MIPLQSALTALIVMALLVLITRRRSTPRHSGLAFLLMTLMWLSLTFAMALVFGIADHPVLGPYVGSLAGPVIAGAVLAVLLEAWAMRRPGSRWFKRLPELAVASGVGALIGLLWQGCDYLV